MSGRESLKTLIMAIARHTTGVKSEATRSRDEGLLRPRLQQWHRALAEQAADALDRRRVTELRRHDRVPRCLHPQGPGGGGDAPGAMPRGTHSTRSSLNLARASASTSSVRAELYEQRGESPQGADDRALWARCAPLATLERL